MLRRIIEFALSQRMLVLVLAALLAGAGGYAFSRLPIDAYPDISTTQVKLILKAPGMTPEEVESRVITPIEMEMLGIPGQAILRSSADSTNWASRPTPPAPPSSHDFFRNKTVSGRPPPRA